MLTRQSTMIRNYERLSTPTINNNKEKKATVNADNKQNQGKVSDCRHRQSKTIRKSEQISTLTINNNKEKWENVDDDNKQQQGKVSKYRHQQLTTNTRQLTASTDHQQIHLTTKKNQHPTTESQQLTRKKIHQDQVGSCNPFSCPLNQQFSFGQKYLKKVASTVNKLQVDTTDRKTSLHFFLSSSGKGPLPPVALFLGPTGPKKVSISRAQPPPTFPRDGFSHIKSLTYEAL